MKKISLILLLLLPYLVNAQYSPKRETRAAWIATVDNIDWPSKPGLPVEQQKEEMIHLLDALQSYHLNTVVFQIRPATDAFYASPYEPWSQWLSGKQGVGPNPAYDPLTFTISECRKRGIEIHAWFNPYRAVFDVKKTITDPNHITNQHPEWFLTYGENKYFDPGLPQTRDYVAKVISDVVRRYDIDAIHLDDYFYPYKIAHVDFPDGNSFSQYPRNFSKEQKEDWRRENVDLIIKQIHDSIRTIKPWVQFGIAPFGVWRNSNKDSTGSKTKAGVTNYDDLYADILKWQKEGWIDYVTPQLYWYIGKKVADYAVLCDWWSHNTYGSQLFIGQAPYLIDRQSKDKAWRSSKEIIRQVNLLRNYPTIQGSMYFSAKYFLTNPNRLKQRLTKKLYRYAVLPPVNNRITPIVPDMPSKAILSVGNNQLKFSWEKGANDKLFVIYRFRKGKPVNGADPSAIVTATGDAAFKISLDKKNNPRDYFYVLTALSHSNLESEPIYFNQE